MSGNGEVPAERGKRGPLDGTLANRRKQHDMQGGAHPRGGVMPNVADMKKAIKDKLTKVPYNVAQYYKKKGFAQWIATHPRFEQVTLTVILLNAIWMFVDTDFNPGDILLESPAIFQIAEQFFCMYFSFEWTMRFTAFQRKCDGFKDRWFVFDSMLVSTMVFETWCMTAVLFFAGGGGSGGLGNLSILRMARLLRLLRMARMARLLRAMPELLILVKGMAAAMRSVGFTLGLLFVILYVFGIAFVQLCDGTECQEMFPDVPTTIHSLLLNAVLMDNLALLIEPLQVQSLVLLFVLYLFILIAALTVMNMLIGVICEVVSAVASTERETLSLGYVRDKMQELYEKSGADDDGDNRICKQEFKQMLQNDVAISLLKDVGVDVAGLVDFVDTIFEKDANEADEEGADEGGTEKTLSFGDFMEVVLDLRGGNNAKVSDVVQLRKYINMRFEHLEKKLGHHGCQTSHPTRPGLAGLYPARSTWAQQTSEDMEPATAAPGALTERAGAQTERAGPSSRTFGHGALTDSSRSSTLYTPAADFSPPTRAASPARLLSPSSRGSLHVGHHQSTRFQNLIHDTQRTLLRAHELEVASLRRENKQLLEQLEQQLPRKAESSHPDGHASPVVDIDETRCPQVMDAVGIDPDGDFDDPVCTEPPRGRARAMRGAATLTMRAFNPSFGLGGGDATSTSEETVKNARCKEAKHFFDEVATDVPAEMTV